MSGNPPANRLNKPIVAMALSRSVHEQMFTPQSLRWLSEADDVRGPVECGTAEQIAAIARDAEVAITGWGTARFDDELLGCCSKLRMIAHSAGSVKGIITDAVYERGIRVTTAAGANAAPVAETTVAMMVVMLKRIPWLLPSGGDKQVIASAGLIRELRDLSVGLISASRVGREVIRLLKSYPRLR